MANVPSARTRVSRTAGAAASGADLICVIAAVALSADGLPRLFGNASDVYAQHGFNRGVEYVALHAERVGKPALFVGLPIATPGVVSRQNTSGNTGTSATTIVAGVGGVLCEHEGVARVYRGGTVGTDQIILEISMDGGRTFKKVRVGTANSYTIPFFNVTINLGAGTLVAGETIHTWQGSDPLPDADGLLLARQKLAAQQKAFRSALLIGDLPSSVEAAAFLAQINAYETSNERYIYGRASVRDRLPFARMSKTRSVMTGSPSLTFAEVGATGDTITRSAGSWIADGFVVGDTVTVALSASNNVSGVIAALSATVLTLGTTDLVAEGPVAGCYVTSEPTITFAEVGATGDTITRSRGSWLEDGFRVGDLVSVASTGSVSNVLTATAGLAAVTASTLTFGTTDLVSESMGSSLLTITAGQTKAAWMAATEAAFASIDAAPRIDLSAGRGRVLSPFSGWFMRQPAAWAASLREYQHDLHIAAWRKSDGPVGFDLNDENGNLVEWDDYNDGGAGLAARFTCLRTYSNGPEGAFVAMSLTRDSDSSVLSLTHNVAVTNLAQSIVQSVTENIAIGADLILNDDGTATSASLDTLTTIVNAALENGLLKNTRGEGQRASKAVWTPQSDTVFNVPEPHLVSTTLLNLNGTIHSVDNVVRVMSGGNT
jgi:hypothetical protein